MYSQSKNAHHEKLKALKAQVSAMLDAQIAGTANISQQMVQMQIILIEILELLTEIEEPG